MALPSVAEILHRSAASREFKAAVRALDAGDIDRARRRIEFGPGEPPMKVLFVVLQVLDSNPHLEVESARVVGQARSAQYSGQIKLQPGNIRFRFIWDCAWKAERMGWRSADGRPDASKAQRELGYQCFRLFEQIK